MALLDLLAPTDDFARRHIGPSPADQQAMLGELGFADLDALTDAALPGQIRSAERLNLPPAHGEQAALDRLRLLADDNVPLRSLIGMGYHGTHTPPVIQRNILENPGWYTQYTPYQAEIAQGRLEALINFQTMVADLTGLPLTNSSLLDEATAAAEAMALCHAVARQKRNTFFVAETCHPQTIAVVQTRAWPLGIQVQVGDPAALEVGADHFGVLLQSPDTHGVIHDHKALIERTHAAGALVVMATDLLACTLMTPPGEQGADVALGNSQRFGVPLGFGGPHAAFFATREEYKRQIPGRIVGVSQDSAGRPAYRLALQTREQHIRRDKATSNICTAQVLLAVMAGMYGVYHGPEGLARIARRVKGLTELLAAGLTKLGLTPSEGTRFDTFTVAVASPQAAEEIHDRAVAHGINLRRFPGKARVGVALDETITLEVLDDLFEIFAEDDVDFTAAELAADLDGALASDFAGTPWARTSPFMTHPNFSAFHAEHELLRYMHRLQGKDLSLTTSMIPLGSCTMKLNATTEMQAVSWPEFGALHPFAPAEQAAGYATLFTDLESWLAEVTGFDAVSLQPNAGSQGEYTGLLVIRAWHENRGQGHRDVCLIPTSAHGTNPASAVMAGFQVVPVACDDRGDIDLADLEAKVAKHADKLAALMITYPSTHGVFEAQVKTICETVHAHGGQVYLDGANMNALVGLARPGELGADVCHLNLHKTFCIPHGGGGPGMGPIGVKAHLAPFLPAHPVTGLGGPEAIGPVSAAPYGSPSILPIPYAYILMMGGEGLRRATQVAILNANYMANRLKAHYDVVYTGRAGLVAHEFILDCRGFKATAGISVDDIAKRLMDFGFHAPTMSWPVAGTLMVEPTESESRAELDRFCDAMIAIRDEIRAIEAGQADRENNPLRRAPHTAVAVNSDGWDRPYGREQAAYPLPWLRERKFWPAVGRVDNAYGDRNLMCSCPPMSAFE
ncbi:MAG: aminomethyl-transferring glycine dehydrogenase [Myxococcales bacterium]|nr:aminomethyl-transferring glycine dehydrogenase [Myxococcales bacterium]